MELEKQMIDIKSLINTQWRTHIENVLKDRRDIAASNIMFHKQTDDKVYSETDLQKERVMIYNTLIKLPKVMVETEVQSVSELLKEWDLDVGSMDDLFKTQE